MSKLRTLHEELDYSIQELKKQLERVDKRKFMLSEKLLLDAITEIDYLTVELRRQAFI